MAGTGAIAEDLEVRRGAARFTSSSIVYTAKMLWSILRTIDLYLHISRGARQLDVDRKRVPYKPDGVSWDDTKPVSEVVAPRQSELNPNISDQEKS